MTRILMVGYDPATVDYSDPALPPGMNAEKVHAGIAVAVKQFKDRGWEIDLGYLQPGETVGPTVERQLGGELRLCRHRGRRSPAAEAARRLRGRHQRRAQGRSARRDRLQHAARRQRRRRGPLPAYVVRDGPRFA